jgi:hypothetical protein
LAFSRANDTFDPISDQRDVKVHQKT